MLLQQPSNKSIPKMKGPPVVGHLFSLMPKNRRAFLEQSVKECGEIAEFKVGPAWVTLINSGTIAYAMMTNTAAFQQGALNHVIAQASGKYSLFALDGDIHRELRKVAAPAFSPRRIAEYSTTMVDRTQRMMSGWKDGDDLYVVDHMQKMTVNFTAKTLFNLESLDEVPGVFDAMKQVMAYVDYIVTHPIHFPLSWPMPSNLRARAAIAKGRKLVQERIDHYRRTREDSGDMLSTMVLGIIDKQDVSKELLDVWMIDMMFNLFAGSIDTVPTMMHWFWFLLCKHPAVYEKLLHEVDTVLQGRPPTHLDLEKLPYLHQVLKEVQRIYPSAYMFGRQAVQDAEIEGYRFPKGTQIAINMYGCHHHSKYFPDPQRFDPDRFSPENEKKLPKGAFLPFGAGPHICIGNHLTLISAPLVLAAMMQRVKFELPEGVPTVPQAVFLLKPPRTTFKVRLRKPPQVA